MTMEFISILNDVLGPVMRGPSSSHTAGSYHIGRIARSLFGDPPDSAIFKFDPKGSYAKTYRQQAVDLAFAAGIMQWSLTDERFPQALDLAAAEGLKIEFQTCHLENAEHPNTVKIRMTGKSGRELTIVAKSIGGGGVALTEFEGWPISLDGKSYELIVCCDGEAEPAVKNLLLDHQNSDSLVVHRGRRTEVLFVARKAFRFKPETVQKIKALQGVKNIWATDPIFYVRRGEPLFLNSGQMVSLAESRHLTLGRIALAYEAQILGIPEAEVMGEIKRRYRIMKSSLIQGIQEKNIRMQLLRPTAGKIRRAGERGRLPVGGLHARAAAGAMAVMHVSNSMGVVCAAPTGASSGVIPGIIVTLAEERKLPLEQIALALLAAGAVGLIILRRATFAAEVAGCQVEIGAAGAMGAAAVVEIAGGSAVQAADAAAISLQNTMGSVCDLIQGICEIPCHTRNAVAASSAIVCADLIVGGYENPVPLDETVDAVFSSGKLLPPELRCTALAGLAVAPSALSIPRLR
jgi:L-serine dehydratase